MNRFILLSIVVLLCAACTNDNLGDIHSDSTPNSKIRNWGEDAAKGRLMVLIYGEDDNFTIEGLDMEVEPLFPGTKDKTFRRWQLVHFDKELDVRSVAERIAQDSRVEIVEFDLPIKHIISDGQTMPITQDAPTRATSMPFNDPGLPHQWHYYNDGTYNASNNNPSRCVAGADINLFEAWKYCTGDNRIIVAVMDEGVATNHPDFVDNMWVNEAEKNGVSGVDDDGNGYIDDIHGYNFVYNTGQINAGEHGTHVAGTISAVNNNNFGVCGIAGGSGKGDGVRIMSLQIFDGDDGCYQYQTARGFIYAADNGAVLMNNSWGYEPGVYLNDDYFEAYDSVLKDAINYFEDNARLDGVIDGGLAIFAAGNETYPESAYPGAYYRYISVSAMAPDYTATCYTNYGPGCNVSAPGGDQSYGTQYGVVSAHVDPENIGIYMQGTSMATPHVTGCAALALSYAAKQGYSLTNAELRNMILTSVHDINAYQNGQKWIYNPSYEDYEKLSLDRYVNKLGSGYIDAHKLLMQLDGTPCLYFRTGEMSSLSLDEFFGDASKSLTYNGCEVSNEVSEALGITSAPTIKNGMLHVTCTKPGTGRIKVSAIIGGSSLGGGSTIGGMLVEREFEMVVRGKVADNGGWL